MFGLLLLRLLGSYNSHWPVLLISALHLQSTLFLLPDWSPYLVNLTRYSWFSPNHPRLAENLTVGPLRLRTNPNFLAWRIQSSRLGPSLRPSLSLTSPTLEPFRFRWTWDAQFLSLYLHVLSFQALSYPGSLLWPSTGCVPSFCDFTGDLRWSSQASLSQSSCHYVMCVLSHLSYYSPKGHPGKSPTLTVNPTALLLTHSVTQNTLWMCVKSSYLRHIFPCLIICCE